MAQQPDFQALADSTRAVAAHIELMPNTPALNEQQRHAELMNMFWDKFQWQQWSDQSSSIYSIALLFNDLPELPLNISTNDLFSISAAELQELGQKFI